jgi:hypothetical protein
MPSLRSILIKRRTKNKLATTTIKEAICLTFPGIWQATVPELKYFTQCTLVREGFQRKGRWILQSWLWTKIFAWPFVLRPIF